MRALRRFGVACPRVAVRVRRQPRLNLTHCTAHGLPVRVCHVQWRDVPKPESAPELLVAPQLFDDVSEEADA